jgi:type IV pilus assembly protein PilQ
MTTNQVSSIEVSSVEVCAKKAGLIMTNKLTVTLAMLAFSLIGSEVFAANAIRDISYSTAANGTTEIALTFAEAPAAPAAFATEAPPRIALDFADTLNELTERRVSIGAGATAAVSAVEAGGKTRVVVELYRKAGYTTRTEGNKLFVSVADGGPIGAQTMAQSTGQSALIQSAASVTNVDFRRGPNGEGRVLISFNKDNIGTDLRKEGNKIIVDIFDVSTADTLPRRLDVTDFATPVNSIETNERSGGVRMEIATTGNVNHMAYQTGTDYVVEITEVKKEEEERRKLGEPPEYVGTPLTFNFQDIPVRSVLQLIADVSQLNIVVADSVQGSVTTRLENVPWDQALDIVLQAKGLDKRKQGGVIWVAPTEEIAAREQALEDARIAIEDREPLISEYISINYGNAKDIAALLTEDAKKATTSGGSGGGGAAGAQKSGQQSGGFLSQRGSVTFDQRTNTLLVNDIRSKVDEIKNLIALLDRPVDQVLIESRIVVATEKFARDLGARFGVSGATDDGNGATTGFSGTSQGSDRIINQALSNRLAGRGTGFPVGLPATEPGGGILVPSLGDRLNVNLPVTNPAGSIGWAVLGANYILDLELSALETEGRGEVVANPRVITANQREAVIRQGSEVGYTTITQTSAGSTTTVAFKPIVLELKATPTITQDDRIFLNLNVKKDELAGFVSVGLSDVPLIDTRELNTAVLVENGQTVVLGGVYEFKSREDLTKVPFLADIPGLGNLFRKKSRSNEKAELLIFVTPKILRQRGKS